MTNADGPIMKGLPDGGAELSVVLRLRWDDVAALGREASRLAEQRGAPVSLDEAASHRLRTWSSVAKPPEDQPQPPAITAPRPQPAHAQDPSSRVTPISPSASRAPHPTAAPTPVLGQTPA
ncbi:MULTISPECIES: hypothetical protein [unclassified Streptomyces]|uniref:hypothetical protein n=1 Tax=unclassified Streptomyces TaxID=2593676 RepID=UPI0021C5B17E|nr:hypothetical protein [Streptomyces sp. FIT100]